MDAKHPRFATLAQAVRAGMQLVPDEAPRRRHLGVSAESGRLGCDALAAAWFAEFYDSTRAEDEDQGLGLFLSRPLVNAYPVLAKDVGHELPDRRRGLSQASRGRDRTSEDHSPPGRARAHAPADRGLARVAGLVSPYCRHRLHRRHLDQR